MYVIAKNKGQYIAIPIPEGASWQFCKVRAGQREIRIVLRVRGRRYMIYTTRSVTAKYQQIQGEHLMSMCNEIIADAKKEILDRQAYIDFIRITSEAELRHLRLWREQGLISVEDASEQCIPPKMRKRVSCVRVELDSHVLFAQETPTDVEQEDLPY